MIIGTRTRRLVTRTRERGDEETRTTVRGRGGGGVERTEFVSPLGDYQVAR